MLSSLGFDSLNQCPLWQKGSCLVIICSTDRVCTVVLSLCSNFSIKKVLQKFQNVYYIQMNDYYYIQINDYYYFFSTNYFWFTKIPLYLNYAIVRGFYYFIICLYTFGRGPSFLRNVSNLSLNSQFIFMLSRSSNFQLSFEFNIKILLIAVTRP